MPLSTCTIQKPPNNRCPSNTRAYNDKISMRRELRSVSGNGGGWIAPERATGVWEWESWRALDARLENLEGVEVIEEFG
jgi:hypothetical protein